ncbi:SCO family protein [Motiliproteus sp. SC1-56]|uniref:SCO family protein n=1 Tax=Motiliproteus sp. SC1-56 TaxID=2799565 RepID=UPI001A8D79C0|nr:SCO family protein [Motiliproteus sp. SC1-56]
MINKGMKIGTVCLLFWLASFEATAALPVLRGLGGDFSAMSTLGREVGPADFQGQPVLLFFGYTNCSDICPATLGHLAELTGDDEVAVQVLFVSVDPEYDTPAHLKAYLAHFDPGYIGISDRRERIDQIVALFQARYDRKGEQPLSTAYKKLKVKKTDGDGSLAYLYSHSAGIYLLDKRSRVRATYFSGTPIAQMRDDIQALNDE